MMGTDTKTTLASLLELIETQLAAEYSDESRQREELENMTVKRFLEMLSYMMGE